MPETVDLSVILTAHDETLVSGPTMASADAAIACAQSAGITVERIIALDNATDATTAWFQQPRFDHWARMAFEEGDLGRVRNAVLPESRGKFIAFLDADDLFSQTWLRAGVQRLLRAEAEGENAIVHPELNWLFDGTHSVYCKPDQDDPLFSPYHFYSMNYYDSLCLTPRAAHLAHPYVHRDIPAGLSFQDWQFAIETMAAGWKHVAARDTIIFKRRRDTSLVNESRARRALVRQIDAMAVDRVATLAIPVKTPEILPTKVQQPDSAFPHYGKIFADRVARAKARRGHVAPADQDAYDAIRAQFDHAFYLARHDDIRALEDVDPVAHYLRAGWRENRDPTPWFNTKAYLDRHPDLRGGTVNPFYHWISQTAPAGEVPQPVCEFDTIAQCLNLSQERAFTLWQARYDDLRHRLEYGGLGAEVVHAATMEPLVEQGWGNALSLRIPPFHNENVTTRTAAMWRLVAASGQTRASHVICVNRARFGAAPRVEGHVARALSEAANAAEVLVITTDHAGPMPATKFPEGVRVVDFASLAPDLKGEARQRVLAEFLRALHPQTVTNVNSRLMWDMMRPYGTALAASMRLYACLLCNERNNAGYWTGYPLRRFYRHFDQLSGVFTDSTALTDDLRDRYALTPTDAARVVTLPNPVDPTIPVATAPSNLRPQIFWAGRFDAQKRVDLVFEIARAMPEADFHLWGEPVMAGAAPLPDPPENLTLAGAYSSFADLPLNTADLWLYTAAWDGVPTMLLEVAMTGIPLVGSDVGGTREVLQDGFATALPATATPQDWVKAIRTVMADETARKKALTLRKRLISTRTPDAHRATLLSLMGLAK